MAATPYQINVPDSRLKDLHQRLELATFPDEVRSPVPLRQAYGMFLYLG